MLRGKIVAANLCHNRDTKQTIEHMKRRINVETVTRVYCGVSLKRSLRGKTAADDRPKKSLFVQKLQKCQHYLISFQ